MSRSVGKLSRDAVKALKVGQSITEGGLKALRLPDGDVRWEVNVMISGRRVHRVLGRASEGVDRASCLAFVERVRTEEREDRLSLPSGRKTHLTVAQVAERYLDRMKTGGGLNMGAKRSHLVKLISYFGKQRADTLSDFTIVNYRKKRMDAGVSATSVNRELATMKHMLRNAVAAKDIKHMPCTIKMAKEPEGRLIILSHDESAKLIEAAGEDQDPYVWLFVQIGLNTAMRHREILGVRFDQIDWDDNRLFVPEAKAGSRTQPLTTVLVEILRCEQAERQDKGGFLFPALVGQTASGHRSSMAKPFRRAVRRVGLDPKVITPHTMRHTVITRLVKAKVDLPTIQKISGHKTLAMVLRYVHIFGTHIDEAMTALDRSLTDPSTSKENVVPTPITQKLHTA